MTGRHAITREAALNALDTPAGRGLIAAMAFGTAFGVALPAANATEQTSDKKVAGVLSVSETETPTAASTEAVTAPEDAEWDIAQVSVEEGRGIEVTASVTIPEPEPVVEEVAPVVEEPVVATPVAAVVEEPVSYASVSESYEAAASEVAAPAVEEEAAPAPSASGSSSSVLTRVFLTSGVAPRPPVGIASASCATFTLSMACPSVATPPRFSPWAVRSATRRLKLVTFCTGPATSPSTRAMARMSALGTRAWAPPRARTPGSARPPSFAYSADIRTTAAHGPTVTRPPHENRGLLSMMREAPVFIFIALYCGD